MPEPRSIRLRDIGRGEGANLVAFGRGVTVMNLFERYLSLWVALCILAGVVLGYLFAPGLFVRPNRPSSGDRAGPICRWPAWSG